ncbi:MAG: hypothetical protein WBI40_13135 [Methylococcaceae bacterium]
MTTKHTPAPWLSDGSTDDGDFVIYNFDCEPNVIKINHGSINPDDFNLILAAPELLEALIACDEAMEYMSEYDIPITLPQQVKDAIAKATQ